MVLFARGGIMEYDRVEIGNRIFVARKNKDLSQKSVSKIIGMNQSAYSKIELGKNNITLPTLFRLCETLDVSIVWILGLGFETDLTIDEQMEIEKYKKYLISKRKY